MEMYTLHEAANSGQLDLFRTILENDSIKNPRNASNGMIPFHFACLKGHINIAEFLIRNHNELNIDLNTRDEVCTLCTVCLS